MNVDLFVRISEDNPRFTSEFHQFMVFPELDEAVARNFLEELGPHNFHEGLLFQQETMKGHCGYNIEQLHRACDVLPEATLATAITNLAAWVTDRKLVAVDYRADTKGVLVTGIYRIETEAAQADSVEVV